ncbi:MAG: hypothetical protein A2Z16_15310 [Chloroflexi bacterium RBG_16_54_18]|nr:MAG: hypothetical protein A2Z16_15310 [Chloroflexi bacterium RBG_16_54_18]
MRRLKDSFIHDLKQGFLEGLTNTVRKDIDLDLQIRDNYLNIYYKGNSLLKLEQAGEHQYRATVHPKFAGGIDFSYLIDGATARSFVDKIPMIKENILLYGKSSLEIEYEQMIVRANNYEPRNNSEYFIVDRQYVAGRAGRFDLTGFYWPRTHRRKNQVVSPCLMEVKFALNQDIQDVHEQLKRYYNAIWEDSAAIAEEIGIIFKQKLELGLFNQPANRLNAMKTLRFSPDIEQFQFILIMVDYNPFSRLLQMDKLAQLSFADQIRIFSGGFAMWETGMKSVRE